MLAEGGSFSGHEQNRFYLNLGEGRFADVSSVVGLDSDRDGRAFSPVDFDRDGDLDLLIKNRNTPQLMLLRNDVPAQNHSIAFKLIGTASNRDAVGAKVRIVTENGPRTKFVRMGSGFLSQASAQIFFGLGDSREIKEVAVFWPSGHQDSFEAVAANQLVTVQEAKGIVRRQPFLARSAPPDRAPEMAASDLAPKLAAHGSWLVEPVPVPELTGRDLAGRELALTRWRGQPVLLNFWASWCAPCREELSQWSAAYGKLQEAGAQVVAVSVDEPGTEDQVRRFVDETKLPFPVLLPDASSIHVYNIFHRNLLRRPRDLQVPTTYLVNRRGEVVKVYRGSTSPEVLLRDLRQAPTSPEDRLTAALPYPGRRVHLRPSRDYVRLAFSFINAGRPEAAPRYLPLALQALEHLARERNDHKMVHLYLGVASLAGGQVGQARTALERAIEIDPDFADAYFNLGVTFSRLGQPRQALAAFEKTVALDPGFADAYFNLALIHRSLGQPGKALAALQRRRQLAPDDAETHSEMGVVLADLGRLDDAIRSFERAVELREDNVEALRNLGVLYYQKGLFARAVQVLEEAHGLAPNEPEISLSLAVAYFRAGRMQEARSILKALLETNPRQPQAQELLQELDRRQDAGQP